MRIFFGSGLLSSITSGLALLRAARDDAPFTWRQALAWLSWGITLALSIGTIVDTYRATRGHLIATDSPVHGAEDKLFKKRLER